MTRGAYLKRLPCYLSCPWAACERVLFAVRICCCSAVLLQVKIQRFANAAFHVMFRGIPWRTTSLKEGHWLVILVRIHFSTM